MKPPAKPRKTPTGCPSSTPSASSAASCLPQSPFPPQHRAAFHDAVLREILQERVPDRRGRRNPRGVKRKMSSFPLRKRGDPTPRPWRGRATCGPFPGQLEPVQGGADRLAATTHPKPLAHQPSQTPQGPAWLGIGAGYGRSSRLLLSIAYGLAKGGLELRAKEGRPPLR